MLIRKDFVSNSSSSSFIVDAESDPDHKLPESMTFEEYCNLWLHRDVFGYFEEITSLKYKEPKYFIECIKRNNELYLTVLKSDMKLGEELLEHIRRTQDHKKRDYARICVIEDILIQHIVDVILPVFKDMNLHYVDASDDYIKNGTNAEEYYEDEYRSISNPKFSRYYNCH